MINMLNELDVAIKASILAGKEIMAVYGEDDFHIEYKENQSPLTEADLRANKVICEMLTAAFPSYALLTEESEDDLTRMVNEYCFIVDPLDGTKEFIKRNGQFTVNIALAFKQRPVMGVIYVPVSGELYFAAAGFGAYHINIDPLDDIPKLFDKTTCQITASKNEITKLKVSERITDIRMVMSSSHGSEQMEQLVEKYMIKNYIKMGSSLKGCIIAKGEAEVYYRFNPTMEWDTAAMQCIACEAGAVFRQMDGTEMLYNRENSLNEKGFYIVNCKHNILML
ncbi:MAG: 3'(2'),5'-bisphosphate nucleotidase CysQ [Lachnospiraceae bacterium]|nr:3'(2'),5'-bisphosphate nucleotidase CysQ [Lachnospiraceae bacterium]